MGTVSWNSFVDSLAVDTIGGSEEIPGRDGGSDIHITPNLLVTYVNAQQAAAAVQTPTTGDELHGDRSGTQSVFTVDAIADYAVTRMWSEATEVSPATNADKLLMHRSGTTYELDIDTVTSYVNSAVLDLTALTAGTPGSSDLMLYGSGSSPRKITLANLETQLWADFGTYVNGLTKVTTTAATDQFWVRQGGTVKYVTPAELSTYFGVTDGDVKGPIATTENYIPMWSSTNKTLVDGIPVLTSVRGSGDAIDGALVSELAVATALEALTFVLDIDGTTELGEGIDDLDTFMLDNGNSGANRRAPFSRVWTWIESKNDVSNASWVVDEDTMSSNSAVRVPTQQSVKAYVDNIIAGLDELTADDIDTLAEINAIIGDATLISQEAADVSSWSWVLDEDDMASDSATKVPTQQSVKAYVDDTLGPGNWDGDATDLDFSTGFELAGALAGDDEFVIGDTSDSDSTKRCLVSRIKTYLETVGHYANVYIDAGAMVPCTTDGAEAATYEYETNDIEVDYFAFDPGATEERVQFKLVMPEDWDRGTIKAKFIWTTATGSSVSDTVEWAIKGGALSNDDGIDSALGTAVAVSDAVVAANGADIQTTAASAAITIAGSPEAGDLVVFEVYRNTDGTDDCAEDAWLLGVHIQYQRNQTVAAW